MRKHLLFSVMLSLCAMGGMMVYPTPAIATVAQSPAIKVRGQVIDEQGEPLTGATVRIKGGQGGTITDVDGNFQLEVAGNAILSISYVGYKEREVAVRPIAARQPDAGTSCCHRLWHTKEIRFDRFCSCSRHGSLETDIPFQYLHHARR